MGIGALWIFSDKHGHSTVSWTNLRTDSQEAARRCLCRGQWGKWIGPDTLPRCLDQWPDTGSNSELLHPPPHVPHTHGYHEVVVSALKSSFACQNQSLFEASGAGELKRGQENNPAPNGLLSQYQRQITCSSHAAADTADQ